LFTENERLSQEKKHYHHDKQLEELRNLQEAIQQERNAFDKERQRQADRLDADRDEIKTLTDALEQQKVSGKLLLVCGMMTTFHI
jgi:predicted house-cleaning noncanonical NTP pyrophosphatase (MazG superfamily)